MVVVPAGSEVVVTPVRVVVVEDVDELPAPVELVALVVPVCWVGVLDVVEDDGTGLLWWPGLGRAGGAGTGGTGADGDAPPPDPVPLDRVVAGGRYST